MNAALMPSGHQTSRQRDNTMENPTIGIKIQVIFFIIVKSMDMLLRIALEHISEVITVDGWVKLHVVVVRRLVTLTGTVQLGQRHIAMNSTKAKGRLMLRM